MPHNRDRRMLLAGLGAAGALAITRTARAATCTDVGSLGPTGPTMRDIQDKIGGPLVKADTRTAIPSLPGTATCKYKITQNGVYFLPGPDIGEPGMNWLEIDADEVEVYFDEYVLQGVAGMRAGIVTLNPHNNIYIYGAAFRDLPGPCIDLHNSNNCLVDTSCFTNCDGFGSSGTGLGIVALGDKSYIWDSDAFGCVGVMMVGAESAIEECSTAGGTGGGFMGGQFSVIENCFAFSNTGDGITVLDDSTVTLCRVAGNGGVVMGARCVCFDNEVTGSPGAGISVMGPDGEVEDNYIASCATGVMVAATAPGTLVDLNHVVDCGTGIFVHAGASRSCVIRNQVGGGPLGSPGYSIGASSSHGDIRDVTGGGNIDVGPLGPVPAWANLRY